MTHGEAFWCMSSTPHAQEPPCARATPGSMALFLTLLFCFCTALGFRGCVGCRATTQACRTNFDVLHDNACMSALWCSLVHVFHCEKGKGYGIFFSAVQNCSWPCARANPWFHGAFLAGKHCPRTTCWFRGTTVLVSGGYVGKVDQPKGRRMLLPNCGLQAYGAVCKNAGGASM